MFTSQSIGSHRFVLDNLHYEHRGMTINVIFLKLRRVNQILSSHRHSPYFPEETVDLKIELKREAILEEDN